MTTTANTFDLELTEVELDHVTGGFTASEHGSSPTTKPSGSGREYLKITMSEGLVTSY